MRFTNKIIERFGVDKVLHFAVCGWMESICCFFGIGGMMWGLLVVFALSVLKELIDGLFDWRDIIAGMLGGIVAGLVYLTFLLL